MWLNAWKILFFPSGSSRLKKKVDDERQEKQNRAYGMGK